MKASPSAGKGCSIIVCGSQLGLDGKTLGLSLGPFHANRPVNPFSQVTRILLHIPLLNLLSAESPKVPLLSLDLAVFE
jgi:hypothetical protein